MPDPEWTSRQRQVLDLLVRGMTNAEMAEVLGISLAGAKWHVSEVITKLGVDSREEAAEYWRVHNGLRPRFTRLLRALLLHGTWLKAGAATAAVAAASAAAVFAIVLLHETGDETRSADSPAVTPTDGVGPTAVPTGSPAPPGATTSPSPAAVPTALATFNGLPVYELVVASPVSLPRDSLLYFSETCAVCYGGQLFRATQASDGTWTREQLLSTKPAGVADGGPIGEFVSDGDGRLAVLWCEGVCGKRHDGTADVTPRSLLLSEDGGVSWRKVSRGPSSPAAILGFVGDQILTAADGVYVLYPSSEQVPTSAADNYRGSTRTAAATVSQLGDIQPPLANDGSSVLAASSAGSAPAAYYAFPGGRLTPTALLSPSSSASQSGERNPC